MSTMTAAALDVKPVKGEDSYTWKLELYEHLGKAWLRWETDAKFRPHQGKVCIYAGKIPEDPNRGYKAFEWDEVTYGNRYEYNTGLDWGSGYSAAWIAMKRPVASNKYVVLAQTPVTE